MNKHYARVFSEMNLPLVSAEKTLGNKNFVDNRALSTINPNKSTDYTLKPKLGVTGPVDKTLKYTNPVKDKFTEMNVNKSKKADKLK